MSSRKPARTAAASITVKDATFSLLRAFGIQKVFGNPGSTELPFLDDWPDDIDYVLGLQEASVVGMADGYAQATRNAGFVNLHSAAGVGNAIGNIFNAYRNQTPLVITGGQQARSIMPLLPFLYSERATEFPQPYVKYSVEPARAEDVPAAIARAYYVAMQPPCGPTFVSVPIDDWTHPTQPVEPRHVSRELGPDPAAMKALVTALAESKNPAFVVGPAVDRAQAVELMVKVAEKAMAAVWASPFSARCSFPERHPQFAGFLHASPAHLSEALREYDLVVVIGAPVFTFHVEGHAAIFDGATILFQITDDPGAAAVTPVGNSIVAHDEAGAFDFARNAVGDKTRVAGRPRAAARPCGRRSASGRIRAAFALRHHGPAGCAGRGSPFASPGDAKIHADARAGQFLHDGERRPRLQPAGRSRRRARPARIRAWSA